jgi:hypothetical protein
LVRIGEKLALGVIDDALSNDTSLVDRTEKELYYNP